MKKKHIVKTVILAIVAVLLIAVLAISNYFLDFYSLIINRVFVGDTADSSGVEAQEALAEANQVAIEASEESIVLLKNDDFLPLKDLSRVNLFGWGSTNAGLLLTGGGSGGTTILDRLGLGGDDEKERVKVDLTDAFKACGIDYNEELTKAYEDFSTFDADYRGTSGTTGANAVDSLKNPPESFYTSSLMNSAKNYSDTAVVVLSRWAAENGGSSELKSIGSYTNGTFLELTAEERAMFGKLEEYDFDVIVLLNVCNNIELGFLEEFPSIKACLYIGIPGQSGITAVPEIITGAVNPSGRTADILPYDHQTNDPVYINAVVNNGNITYQEGIYFGYKWYETADADGYFDKVVNGHGQGYDAVVQFPFGYGLSYTEFEWKTDWKNVTSLTADGSYTVAVTVKNIGKEAGKDVVQLYGHAPYIEGGIEKAERVLLDFAKTPLLKPGESCEVQLNFTAYDLASYDDYDKNSNGFCGYELDAGNYEFAIMKNSHDFADIKTVTLDGNIRYEEDPVTGKTVGNLFTGEDAYAGCPVDGSTALNNPVEYLSRANAFSNIPTAQAGGANVGNAASYRHNEYDNKDVSDIAYGEDAGLYLVQVVKTEGEGESAVVTTRRATEEELNATAKLAENEVFEYNKELLKKLINYDDDELWNTFLNQLTENEVKDLIGMGGFMTKGLYSVGKPRCTDKDGPAGFNNNVTNRGYCSEYTLFPSESLLGCCFNKEVGRKIGIAQGKIGSAMGINGWYAPGANLHRSVFNSRNYEYFSEDPVLSGKLSAEIILGAKDNNVYCYMKHFAVSEEGQNPKMINTWLTEQTLRESYLRPFEIAVKNGEANAIMSAFNNVGAVLSGYNYALLTGVLRNEWGFRGSVITDWYTASGYMNDHTLGVLAGNDLWLCGSAAISAKLDLTDPAVAYAARQSVKNILYTYVDTYVTATTIKINAEAVSPLFAALWIGLDVVLIAGIIVCLIFIALPFIRGKKQNRKVTGSDKDVPSDD